MTYFGFLSVFLVIPILLFLFITWPDNRQGRQIVGFKNGRAVWYAIGLHMLIAVIYTTPWDNYLVATRVWTYNPSLVTGKIIGYVPIEEYTFFLLETLLAGLVWWAVARRVTATGTFKPSMSLRLWSAGCLGIVWLVSVFFLVSRYAPATYLAITLAWALPPIGLQLIFGADILWRHRRLLTLSILPMLFYLSLADSLAIASGTWTISPAQSTGFFLGALPIEEAVFFMLTLLLVVFGQTLLLAGESNARFTELVALVWKPRGK
jgi:lycopene cyclase domain-containing protein